MTRYTVMTSIPYVNGKPHIGHALELVQADVLARHRRLRGDDVRAQTGTDDHALKNVQAAEAQGQAPAEYVARAAERFVTLGQVLDLSFDDFIKTSSDPRHAPSVAKLWSACAERGDFYRKTYAGHYCVGCELFYTEDELTNGHCPEHSAPLEWVEEDNWFFRLSRYQDQLFELISADIVKVEPATRKREVLSFIRSGLTDFSVSRSMQRAKGWGIPVPGDPGQVIYVWYDALANYLTGPGYGTDPAGFARWWEHSDDRVHIIGKGILRFHAVYWPAMLLSAGITLPTRIFVHEYLTVNGQKISKSLGNAEDPADIVQQYGVDALRWWLLSEVTNAGDTDYTAERLVGRANRDLANNVGNFISRTAAMVNRYRPGVILLPNQDNPAAARLRAVRAAASATIDQALDGFDFRRATSVVTEIADEANKYVETTTPWLLAKDERRSDDLDTVLAELVATCSDLAVQLKPFLPDAARRIEEQFPGNGLVASTQGPLFPRLDV